MRTNVDKGRYCLILFARKTVSKLSIRKKPRVVIKCELRRREGML